MNQINFVDQTIRDAQQSLWGLLMSTDMILPIAPVMDQVGYKAIATVGGRGAIVGIRHLGEDVLGRMRLLCNAMQRTPVRSSFATWSFSGFDIDPPAALELWIRRAAANGMRSFWVVDYQTNLMDNYRYLIRVTKEVGAEVVTSLMYTLSPVHTDELWAQKTRKIVEAGDVDIIMLEDTGGVLTPERTRTLLPAIERESKGLPIEFHSHCNLGVANLSYLEAIKLGVESVHTAVSPLANDTSLPSTENILKNARRLGYSSNLDEEALKAVSDHFRKIAEERGLRTGVPLEYDLFNYEHQVPGGMMGTMRNQLAELGIEHRLPEVLEEVAPIRKEFGYPVMATPYSQFICAQALFNITSGERYKIVADEVIKYMLGLYGEPDGPVDQNVKDKILGSPKAKKWMNWSPPDITVDDLRREVGAGLSDDELLYQLANPVGEFKAKLDALYGKK